MVSTVMVERAGDGEPLLLIHGTGGTRAHWDPVRDRLEKERSLLLVDLPGHGESSTPPSDIAPTPIGYAEILGRVLDELGHESVHVAGNSVGGWTALELAKRGRARSVVAIGPAGLWASRNPLSARMKLAGQYRSGRRFARVVPRVMRSELGRTVLLRDTVAKPRQVPAEDAVEMAVEFARTRGFDAHLKQTSAERFRGGEAITVPVTVAWGEKERLIPKRARRLDELPEQTRVLSLPGCGHTPMWDDPGLVAQTILAGATAVPRGQPA